MSKQEVEKKNISKEELKDETLAWARFLYKVYREQPEIVKLVLEEDQ